MKSDIFLQSAHSPAHSPISLNSSVHSSVHSALHSSVYPSVHATAHVSARTVRLRVGRGLLLGSLLLLLLVAIVLYAHGYAAWRLVRPAIAPLSSNPQHAVGLSYETVSFQTDTAVLEGWYIAAPTAPPTGLARASTFTDSAAASDVTVVLSHGYGGNREEIWVPFYTLAEVLHNQNYNVLMFDYGYVDRTRNPNRVISGGVHEAAELNAAIAYARQLGASRVVVWGFSMGAGIALQAALQADHPPDAMILDSTFLPEAGTLKHQLRTLLPYAPDWSSRLIGSMLPLVSGPRLSDIPSDAISAAPYPMPLLLVHGQKDKLAPYTLSESIYRSQQHQPLTALWLPEARGHEMTLRFQQDEYLERAFRFLNQVLLQ